MKPIELQLPLGPGGVVTLPPEVLAQVGYEETVRLIVMVPDELSEEEEEAAWKRFAAEQFFKGYAPEAAIYDEMGNEDNRPAQ